MAILLLQDILELREGVGSRVGWVNFSIRKPLPGRQFLEVADGGFKVFKQVSVLGRFGTLEIYTSALLRGTLETKNNLHSTQFGK